MKRDILVPFDGSDNALEALSLAITLAQALQEKIILLNVQHTFHTPHVKKFFNEATVSAYQQQLFEEAVAPARDILTSASVPYEMKLRIGDPKEQICDEAQAGGGDACATTGIRMIVMGSRGMNPIMGGVLGSVSYGVINSALCPVTIVPFSCLAKEEAAAAEESEMTPLP